MSVSLAAVARCRHYRHHVRATPRVRARPEKERSRLPAVELTDFVATLSERFGQHYGAMSEVQKKLQDLSDDYQKLQGGSAIPKAFVIPANDVQSFPPRWKHARS